MSRLPNVDGPSLTGTMKRQRELLRKQGTASAFSATGVDAVGYVDEGDASTLAAAKAYSDAATTFPGLEAPVATGSIAAATVTPLPWGAPTENSGGFVVSTNTITIPAGMGGVYTVTVEVDVANTQTTRGFVNLYMGATRNNPRGVFTSDSKGSVSATARLADLAVVKTEIYCATATSSTGGWLTLYRLHA